MEQAPARQIDVRDVDALRPLVSETFGEWSKPLVITQDMVNRFAELTGDRQWIHVDVERARLESPFGAPVVHGFLLLSLMPSLRAPPAFALTNYGSAANFGSAGLRFLAGARRFGRAPRGANRSSRSPFRRSQRARRKRPARRRER